MSTSETSSATSGGCPVGDLGERFDPFAEPHEWYETMTRAREQEPVFYSPRLGYWVVTRYDDIMMILRDNETYSSVNAIDPIRPPCPAAIDVLAGKGMDLTVGLVNIDPPEHALHRQIMRKSFTPARVAGLRPQTEILVDEAIDRFADRGEADLVRDLVWEIPAKVIFILMGVPASELERIRTNTARATQFGWGLPSEQEQVEIAQALGEYWDFAGGYVDRFLADPPKDNMMGDLIRARDPETGEPLYTRAQLCALFINGLLAGHETTTNASAAGFRWLLEHREQWEAICEDPGLIPNAVEEILRIDSSVPTWRRKTTRPVTIGGVDLPEGTNLLISLGSANRDTSHFSDAGRFDVRRDNAKQHLALSWGRHACLGATLARMEMAVVLERLTARLPDLRLVPGQSWEYPPNTSFRGPEHVLVTWDPASNPTSEPVAG